MEKRKTKIIATVGPASVEESVFLKMIEEGVDIIRINTAYSSKEQLQRIEDNMEKLPDGDKPEVIFDIRSIEVTDKITDYNPEMVAVSFSESAKQLKAIKDKLGGCKIIAKIESNRGVENFEEILEFSWGVMIARGDLGVAISLERVPCVQKKFSKMVLEKGKFLIIATEMLLSMERNSQPTRAEASDVANAVFSGACSVMLSEETAIGKYPVEAVRYMRKIIEEAEKCTC